MNHTHLWRIWCLLSWRWCRRRHHHCKWILDCWESVLRVHHFSQRLNSTWKDCLHSERRIFLIYHQCTFSWWHHRIDHQLFPHCRRRPFRIISCRWDHQYISSSSFCWTWSLFLLNLMSHLHLWILASIAIRSIETDLALSSCLEYLACLTSVDSEHVVLWMDASNPNWRRCWRTNPPFFGLADCAWVQLEFPFDHLATFRYQWKWWVSFWSLPSFQELTSEGDLCVVWAFPPLCWWRRPHWSYAHLCRCCQKSLKRRIGHHVELNFGSSRQAVSWTESSLLFLLLWGSRQKLVMMA